ncbi:class I SAM-dependent methyltransferase [Streptomyces otsuchiensis]|uniref:class I SAM-dependent methyltransferase n=1 Tax=Streptomyces otsuchiensis TaxID=2681388 RepID=UPI00102FEB16|nr:class I SAM-dependent methyltransferase [Streptomyces otsuchiensis]
MSTIASRPAEPEVDAVRHHYEVGNEFYRLILGASMMYSGGYWEPGEELVGALDTAQERKLDAFVRHARAEGAEHILDIGCGWGTLMDRATRLHGVKRATGLTLSRTQREWIEGLRNPALTTRVESWSEHENPGAYQAAFCVNALEHFVSSSLPPRERTKRYRFFFQQVHRALAENGRFVLHTMTAEAQPMTREILADLKFLQRSEFEGMHIPHLHELAAAAEGLFEFVEVVNERESFARACRAWLELLAADRPRAVELESEEVVARFERYLDIFAYTLEDRFFNNFRVVLERKG